MRLKRQLIRIHKWVGLTLALILSCQALTGLMLVYRADIHNWLAPHPQPAAESASGGITTEVSAQQLVQAIRTKYPGYTLSRLVFPATEHQRYIVYLRSQANPQEHRVVDFAWPSDLSGVESSDTLATLQLIYGLHHTLLGGTFGRYLIGITGLGLLFMIVSGIFIWWPRGRRFKQALVIHKYRQATAFYYQLHRTLGVTSSVMLLVLAGTGGMLAFGPELRSALNVGAAAMQHSTNSVPCNAGNLDQQIASAQALFPSARVRDMRFLDDGVQLHRVLFAHESPVGEAPPHQVWLDQCTGTAVRTQSIETSTAMDNFFAWLFPVHTGRAIGRPGQALNLLAGLFLLTGVISALLLWLLRRRKPGGFSRTARARKQPCS